MKDDSDKKVRFHVGTRHQVRTNWQSWACPGSSVLAKKEELAVLDLSRWLY